MKKIITLSTLSVALFTIGLIFTLNSGAKNVTANEPENNINKANTCSCFNESGSCGCVLNKGVCNCSKSPTGTCMDSAIKQADSTGGCSCRR